MAKAAGDDLIYEFGPFRLDSVERLLLREGLVVPLTPKAFDLLVYLVQRHGRLAEKQALLSALWPDAIVEEGNLASNVAALRKALDDGSTDSMIQTVPTKGYRFVGIVTTVGPIAPADSQPALRPWWRSSLLWAGATVVLVLCSIAVRVLMRPAPTEPPAAAVLDPENVHVRKLTDNDMATDAAISPDRRYVAFVRGDGATQSLWLRQVDTRTDVRIIAPDGHGFLGLTFSPDGSLIYYLKPHPSNVVTQSLYSMSILGGAARMVIDDVNGPISFSPDGKQFVYELCRPTGIQVRIARVDSDNESQLALIHDGACDIFQPGPRWSPDGRTVVVPALLRTKPNRWILSSVSVENRSVRELFASAYRIGRPVWIAGGQALLVPHTEERFGQLQLWTVTFPAGVARRVTDDLASYDMALDATPDGHAAVSTVTTRISNIWVVPTEDPEHARQVSEGLPISKASEFADGRIVSVGFEGKLWSMNADGSQRAPFSSLRDVGWFWRCGNVVIAAVTPTMTSAALGGGDTLVRIDMDGTHATPLISGNLSGAACSATGKFLFYLNAEGSQQRTFRIPIAGGTASEVGHGLPVGVSFRWPLGVSPDETRLAYLQNGHAPGSPEGWQIAVVRTDDGSPVASWAVDFYQENRLYRWSESGLAWRFVRAENGVFNVWEQSLPGGAPKQLTRFTSGQIFNFDWSPDEKRLVMTRGSISHDVVLLNLQ